MKTPVRADLHVLDIGPPAWCWSRLACTSTATLSFSVPGGRLSIDVRYSLGNGQIVVAMASADAPGWQAAGRSATLKISGVDDDQLRWSVRATGLAHRAGNHLLDVSADPLVRTPAPRPAWLALSLVRVRGCYETSALDGLDPLPGDPLVVPAEAGSGDALAPLSLPGDAGVGDRLGRPAPGAVSRAGGPRPSRSSRSR